jgi:hypothetical protein
MIMAAELPPICTLSEGVREAGRAAVVGLATLRCRQYSERGQLADLGVDWAEPVIEVGAGSGIQHG